MTKAVKWERFGTKVNPKNNVYNTTYKNFRHQGTLASVQVLDDIDLPVAYEEPIEDYIAAIRERSTDLIEATITQDSYVEQAGDDDTYAETETFIRGWRAELTEPEKKAVREYFEGISIVE